MFREPLKKKKDVQIILECFANWFWIILYIPRIVVQGFVEYTRINGKRAGGPTGLLDRPHLGQLNARVSSLDKEHTII